MLATLAMGTKLLIDGYGTAVGARVAAPYVVAALGVLALRPLRSRA